MKLSTPDADEVFNRFLNRIDSNKLNKKFGVTKEAITAAESVKNVEKSAFLFFVSETVKKKQLKDKPPNSEIVSASKIENVKFYSFKDQKGVDPQKWKEKDYVPMLKDLKEIKCQKCSGKGTQKCDQCNNSHFLSCEDCKGKGSQKCEKCKGSGKITIEIDVREVNQTGDEKKKAEKRIHQCRECFGEGKLTCRKCGGNGKIVCYECKGRKLPCNECNGVGIFYELTESPVPLFITPSKENYSFMAKKDQWMMKDKEYNNKLESAETYSIRDIKKINENLKELFRVISIDKDLKKCIDETRKTWENLEKEYNKGKSHERPLKPISLVFLLRLFVETPKKKKFDIYALGTKSKFSIMTYNF